MKIANYLKIEDRKSMALTCKKLSVGAPGLIEMRRIHQKVMKMFRKMQGVGYFCRICHDFVNGSPEPCYWCTEGVCGGCIDYDYEHEYKACILCFSLDKCEALSCYQPAFAKCFTCTKKICPNHAIKTLDVYECHDCLC